MPLQSVHHLMNFLSPVLILFLAIFNFCFWSENGWPASQNWSIVWTYSPDCVNAFEFCTCTNWICTLFLENVSLSLSLVCRKKNETKTSTDWTGSRDFYYNLSISYSEIWHNFQFTCHFSLFVFFFKAFWTIIEYCFCRFLSDQINYTLVRLKIVTIFFSSIKRHAPVTLFIDNIF